VSIDIFSRVKGQVAQGLACALLEDSGYRVSRLGVEEQHIGIKHIPWDTYRALGLPLQLRTLPDLFVTNSDSSLAWLVEVKMRSDLSRASMRQLGDSLAEQAEYWPNTHTILFVSSPTRPERGYIQDHLRVVTPSQIQVLQDMSLGVTNAWDSLSMFPDVFELVESVEFYKNTDQVVPAIRSLAYAKPPKRPEPIDF
jgi:hypothetical protein